MNSTNPDFVKFNEKEIELKKKITGNKERNGVDIKMWIKI